MMHELQVNVEQSVNRSAKGSADCILLLSQWL